MCVFARGDDYRDSPVAVDLAVSANGVIYSPETACIVVTAQTLETLNTRVIHARVEPEPGHMETSRSRR